MGGLFSGLGLSSKKDKKPTKKSEPKVEHKADSKQAANSTAEVQKAPTKEPELKTKENKPIQGKPADTKTDAGTDVKSTQTSSPPKKASPPKPATNQTSTSKQPTSERSPKMRLSKNAPKKVDNDFDIPSDPIAPSPSYTSSSTSIGTKVEPKITPCATIGPKISFKGELSGEEDLLVQGYVEGTINLKNNHLIIGKLGTVKADITAKTITVEGTVEGNIVGQEKVEITATSRVDGNLKAERVILEDGAKFRGSIDMGSTPKPAEPKTTQAAKSTAKAAPATESSEKKPDTV